MNELLVLHKKEGRVVNRFRVKNNSKMTTIGSARSADIRLLGDDIELLHACFEQRGKRWKLIDLASHSGTWIDKKPIVEKSIDDTQMIQIGEHSLEVVPVSLKKYFLFSDSNKIDVKGEDQQIFQQVAIFLKGELLESYLEDPGKQISTYYKRKRIVVPPAKDTNWQVHENEDYVVKNRLVRSTMFNDKEKIIYTLFPKDLIKPAIASLAIMSLFLLSIFLIPKAFNTAPDALKLAENQYTKLIFDEKIVKKQKEKALEITKKMKIQPKNQKVKPSKVAKESIKPKAIKKTNTLAANKQSPALVGRKKSNKKVANLPAAPKSNGKRGEKATKVVTSIRNSGLSQMIGKVSQRAADNAMLVQANGIKAKGNVGRGTASIGKIGKGGGKTGGLGGGKGPGSFKVDGVGTVGAKGGSAIASAFGGLNGGAVGKGAVEAIEEETEVRGGLDPEVIARVVKKNIGAIRMCYERRLAANPSLHGKVKVEFVVNATGVVPKTKIKSTTLRDARVEGCMQKRIRTWNFPKPKGGTEVVVSYPFFFKANQ